jgi:hypothetical protein
MDTRHNRPTLCYFLPSQDTLGRRSLDALFTQCASTLNRKKDHKNQHENEYSIDTSFTLFIKITIILFTVVSQHTLNMIHIQFIRNQSSEYFYKNLLQSFLYYSIITNVTIVASKRLHEAKVKEVKK